MSISKRHKEQNLLQREVAAQMGINLWAYSNWEKDKTAPVAARFLPVVTFPRRLGKVGSLARRNRIH